MNNNENNLTRTKRRKNCAKSLRTTVSCETGFENGKEKMFVLCAVRIAECAGQGRETKPFPCTIRPFNLATPLQEKEKTNRNRLKEKEWILKIFNIFRGKKNNIPSVEQLPASDGAVSLGAPACPEWDCKGMSCHGGRQEAQRNNACFTVRTS